MIGLFLGDTDFSKIVLKKIKKLKKKYFIIDFSNKNDFAKEKNSYRISIGKFGKIIDLIKKQKSNKVLFAGKIAKPKFSTLRLDLKGIYYMPSIIKAAKLGDAAIIKVIIEILKNEKIDVISSIHFNPELTGKKGLHTKIKPSRSDIKSINRGIKYLAKTNSYDHIQAIAVRDNKIIAKEDNRGTKKMMSKLKNNSGGILIKFPKKKYPSPRAKNPSVSLFSTKTAPLRISSQKNRDYASSKEQNVFILQHDATFIPGCGNSALRVLPTPA